MITKKIRASSMYGRVSPNNNTPTQSEQAKAAVNLLLRVPVQDPDFLIGIETLQHIIDTAQNQPPQGAADGSINEYAWIKLSSFLKSCKLTYVLGCQACQHLEGIKGPLPMQTGVICPLCDEPQFQTPSGPTCKNGHGGVEGIPHK